MPNAVVARALLLAYSSSVRGLHIREVLIVFSASGFLAGGAFGAVVRGFRVAEAEAAEEEGSHVGGSG